MWPDKETSIDYLNFGYLVDLIVEIAMNRALTPSTIGLYGDWGSGKSSLMKLAQDRIEELSKSKKKKDDDTPKTQLIPQGLRTRGVYVPHHRSPQESKGGFPSHRVEAPPPPWSPQSPHRVPAPQQGGETGESHFCPEVGCCLLLLSGQHGSQGPG